MTHEMFKQNVFSLRDEMFRFAKSILVSRDEAEDAVQDLMMKFWQGRENFAQMQNIRSYVLKAIKNECLNRLRSHDMKQDFAERQQEISESCSRPEPDNLKEEILKFIAQLPERQRMVIHLKDVEEYDVSEICEILAMEENAIRANLMRARQKVKEQILQLRNYENRPIQR